VKQFVDWTRHLFVSAAHHLFLPLLLSFAFHEVDGTSRLMFRS